MAVVKVFDVNGSKTLLCFDTLVDIPYDEDPLESDEDLEDEE